MSAIFSAPETWSIWHWCLGWMAGWAIVMGYRKLPEVTWAIAAGRFGRKEVLFFLIFFNRVFLLFVAWWFSRFLISLIFPVSVIHWIGTVVLFFIVVSLMLSYLGHVGSVDFSGRRLTKEYVAIVIGLVFLFLVDQTSSFSTTTNSATEKLF